MRNPNHPAPAVERLEPRDLLSAAPPRGPRAQQGSAHDLGASAAPSFPASPSVNAMADMAMAAMGPMVQAGPMVMLDGHDPSHFGTTMAPQANSAPAPMGATHTTHDATMASSGPSAGGMVNMAMDHPPAMMARLIFRDEPATARYDVEHAVVPSDQAVARAGARDHDLGLDPDLDPKLDPGPGLDLAPMTDGPANAEADPAGGGEHTAQALDRGMPALRAHDSDASGPSNSPEPAVAAVAALTALTGAARSHIDRNASEVVDDDEEDPSAASELNTFERSVRALARSLRRRARL